jgi:hypothetical protein
MELMECLVINSQVLPQKAKKLKNSFYSILKSYPKKLNENGLKTI